MTTEQQNRNIKIMRALISSYNKEKAIILARCLDELNVEIVASGGTADAIESTGIKVERISDSTGFSSLLGGRVKTLHPAIYAAILSRRDEESDMEDLEKFDVKPVDLVAVDLYPFPMDGDVSLSLGEIIELIDIGGVSLIRASAKNHRFVTVLSHSDQFKDFSERLSENSGLVDLETRQNLAVEAFHWITAYDARIAEVLSSLYIKDESKQHKHLCLKPYQSLRYGENPHQPASFFVPSYRETVGIADIKQYGGKKLSFNNLLDLDIALRLPREFEEITVAILKHTTPCGVGTGESLHEAFVNAISTDPQSAFGSIVGTNVSVDLETAREIRKGFVEVVVAPGFTPDALKELKRSKNLRIIEFTGSLPRDEDDFRSIWGGALIQKRDTGFAELDDVKVVTRRQATEDEMTALRFAWKCVRYIKSNAILIAEKGRTIGIGAGQMSRVDAAHLAVWKAKQSKLNTKGAVAASDAFFPFRDGLDVLVDAGITAIIEPGGSIRDQEVIDASDERKIALVFTGRRHFRH